MLNRLEMQPAASAPNACRSTGLHTFNPSFLCSCLHSFTHRCRIRHVVVAFVLDCSHFQILSPFSEFVAILGFWRHFQILSPFSDLVAILWICSIPVGHRIQLAVLFAWPFYSPGHCIQLAVLFGWPFYSVGRFVSTLWLCYNFQIFLANFHVLI